MTLLEKKRRAPLSVEAHSLCLASYTCCSICDRRMSSTLVRIVCTSSASAKPYGEMAQHMKHKKPPHVANTAIRQRVNGDKGRPLSSGGNSSLIASFTVEPLSKVRCTRAIPTGRQSVKGFSRAAYTIPTAATVICLPTSSLRSATSSAVRSATGSAL